MTGLGSWVAQLLGWCADINGWPFIRGTIVQFVFVCRLHNEDQRFCRKPAKERRLVCMMFRTLFIFYLFYYLIYEERGIPEPIPCTVKFNSIKDYAVALPLIL